MNDHEHDPEPTECRDCGATFDLARQHYYDNRCPSCVEDEDPERTWPMCAKCDGRVPPDEQDTTKTYTEGVGYETLTVHEACAVDGDDRVDRTPA